MDDSTHYERVATAVATHWYNSLAPAMRQALQANLSTNDWTALRDITARALRGDLEHLADHLVQNGEPADA